MKLPTSGGRRQDFRKHIVDINEMVMTPKEKARELFDKMSFETHKHNAKQCALIAVDEILNIDICLGCEDCCISTKYWQEVKTELEKL